MYITSITELHMYITELYIYIIVINNNIIFHMKAGKKPVRYI